ELKTKPTQHSVKELRSIGIQPDILVCRSEQPLPDGERRKIALFTNVTEKAVISAVDLDNIHKLPMWMHAQGLDGLVVERLRLEDRAAPTELFAQIAVHDDSVRTNAEVKNGVVDKYVDDKAAYKSVVKVLRHGGIRQRTRVNLRRIESQDIERDGAERTL